MIKRLIFVGDQCSGKTTLLTKFINKYDVCDYSIYFPTNGIDLNIYSSGKTKYYLWDTSGDMRYRYIINSYTKKSDCTIIVYDISNIKNSVENLRIWIDNIKKDNENVKIITIANKKDKIKNCESEVIEYKNILFEKFEIYRDVLCDVCVENDNIDDIFSKIFEIVADTEDFQNFQNSENNENNENNENYFVESPKSSKTTFKTFCCFC